MFFFFFYLYGNHLDLHSFPTRRSSDLGCIAALSKAGYREKQHDANGKDLFFEHRLFPPQTRKMLDRKSTRLNSSHEWISYAVFCLKKKKKKQKEIKYFLVKKHHIVMYT